MVLYCLQLNCMVLHCIVLHGIWLFVMVLHGILMFCVVMHRLHGVVQLIWRAGKLPRSASSHFLMISQHEYTPLLLGACLIQSLQSVPTLEKWQARSKIHCCCQLSGTFSTLPTIYKGSFVNREAFSIFRKAGRWVFGEVHSLLCDEVNQTFKITRQQ